MEDRELSLIVRNAEGKVKSAVLKVLDLEIAQIESYLDRPEPNVSAALVSVAHIKEMMEQING